MDRFRVVTLIFNHSPHCTACHEAMPHLDEFERLHRLELNVLRVQGDALMEQLTGWVPAAIPSYALKVDGELAGKMKGGLSLDELTAWVDKILLRHKQEPLRAVAS